MAREQVKLKKAGAPVAIKRGQLLRDGARADDSWTLLADDAAIPAEGDIVVTATRFKAEREALLARNAGRLGVSVASADAIEDIAEDVSRFSVIFVEFPTFRDGRGYSSARLLRERYAYKGELRAIGDVLEDQIFYMLRCGFDALEINAPDPEKIFARAAKSFSVAYQPAVEGLLPAHILRARQRAGKAE
jgi:uncharacterized protein (DUF934 family)